MSNGLPRLSVPGDNAAIEAEPLKSDQPTRNRLRFQRHVRMLLVFVLAASSQWLCLAASLTASEPQPAKPGTERVEAASATSSSTKLATVLRDPKYASLIQNDLERDMVRYYVFFEDVPRHRREEFWRRKGSLRRLTDILTAEDLRALIDDARLAPLRDRRNALTAVLRDDWSAKPLISDGLMRDDGIYERPLRLWATRGSKHPMFLASLGQRPSPPRTLSTLQIIHELLKPSGPLPKPPHDFLNSAGSGAEHRNPEIGLPDRYQGLAGMGVGLFEEHGDLVVVCQDGSLVHVSQTRMADDAEVIGESHGGLDARALAGRAARQDSSVTLVSVEPEEPASCRIVVEIAGRAEQPKLVARTVPIQKLKDYMAEEAQQKTGTLPRLIWAGCTRPPETRLWAYDCDSNELLGFNDDGRVEFRETMLAPDDYDWLRGACIAAESADVILANLFKGEAGVKDGVPISHYRPHAVVGEVTVEDHGRDLFRSMVRVIEWRGESWAIYPEFRRGNLVLRKIENQQLGTGIPVPKRGRVIDFEPLMATAWPLLATREYDEQQKKIACCSYEFHSGAWRTAKDWHEPTNQEFVYLPIVENGKSVVYFATTTMPLKFVRQEFPSHSSP